jgi:hypothetical protein
MPTWHSNTFPRSRVDPATAFSRLATFPDRLTVIVFMSSLSHANPGSKREQRRAGETRRSREQCLERQLTHKIPGCQYGFTHCADPSPSTHPQHAPAPAPAPAHPRVRHRTAAERHSRRGSWAERQRGIVIMTGSVLPAFPSARKPSARRARAMELPSPSNHACKCRLTCGIVPAVLQSLQSIDQSCCV